MNLAVQMPEPIEVLGNYLIWEEYFKSRFGEFHYAIYCRDGRRIFRAHNLSFARVLLRNLCKRA